MRVWSLFAIALWGLVATVAGCGSSNEATWDVRRDLRDVTYVHDLDDEGTAQFTVDARAKEVVGSIRIPKYRDPIAVRCTVRKAAALDLVEAAFDEDGNPSTASDQRDIPLSSGRNIITFPAEGAETSFGFWLEIEASEVAFLSVGRLSDTRPAPPG